MILFNLNYLLLTIFPDIVMLEVRVSTYGLGGEDRIQSIKT
jgi:hypothetical protein